MIKNYLKNISEKILNPKGLNEEQNLTILRWLICYQQDIIDGYPPTDMPCKHVMINTLKKNEIFSDTSNPNISNSQYEKYIYKHTLETVPGHIQDNTASDYDILLYVYTLFTTPIGTGENIDNIFLCIKEEELRPYWEPHVCTSRLIQRKSLNTPVFTGVFRDYLVNMADESLISYHSCKTRFLGIGFIFYTMHQRHKNNNQFCTTLHQKHKHYQFIASQDYNHYLSPTILCAERVG